RRTYRHRRVSLYKYFADARLWIHCCRGWRLLGSHYAPWRAPAKLVAVDRELCHWTWFFGPWRVRVRADRETTGASAGMHPGCNFDNVWPDRERELLLSCDESPAGRCFRCVDHGWRMVRQATKCARALTLRWTGRVSI